MRPDELADRFETLDGSRPEATPLNAQVARSLPLAAFGLLRGGDVFESVGGKPPPEGAKRAKAFVERQFHFEAHGASASQVQAVRAQLCEPLSANLQLVARMEQARPIRVDLIPPGKAMSAYGFPRAVSPRAAGLFWDHPSWPEARIAFRQDKLLTERALVVHELAHALQALAFSEEEREDIYRVMLRTYRSRAAVDEVFAIYSEREFLPDFQAQELRAPGVYGLARSRWSEAHVFTRFVRHLYFPHKPLSGGGLG